MDMYSVTHHTRYEILV